MLTEDIFISQHGQTIYADYGCGVASLMMLLKNIHITPLPSWEDLCKVLHIAKDPTLNGYQHSDPKFGLYPEDLFRYIIRENLLFRMHFFDNEWKNSLLIAPIMVLLNGILKEFPNEAHWVVLIQLHENYFTYFDPWEKSINTGKQQISFEKFKQVYTGIACQLFKN